MKAISLSPFVKRRVSVTSEEQSEQAVRSVRALETLYFSDIQIVKLKRRASHGVLELSSGVVTAAVADNAETVNSDAYRRQRQRAFGSV